MEIGARQEGDRRGRRARGNVKQTLAGPVRVRTHHHHGHRGDKVRHGRDQAHHEIAQPGGRPDDLRQPQAEDIHPERFAEEDGQRQPPYGTAREGLGYAQPVAPPAFLVLLAHARAEPRPLRGCEPRRVLGAVGQVAQDDEAERNCGQAFEEEEPLPPRESPAPIEPEQRAREGIAHDPRERDGNHELGDRPRPLGGGKPPAQVVDDAWEEAGFGHPQQEAQPVEAERPPDEHHGRRQEPPRDHEAGDPNARAQSRQDEVAGDPERHVAEKEDTGSEAVDGGAEAQVGVHLERGNPDVGPVQEAHDVEEEEKGEEPPGHLGEHGPFQRIGGAWRHRLRQSGGHGRASRGGTSEPIRPVGRGKSRA